MRGRWVQKEQGARRERRKHGLSSQPFVITNTCFSKHDKVYLNPHLAIPLFPIDFNPPARRCGKILDTFPYQKKLDICTRKNGVP